MTKSNSTTREALSSQISGKVVGKVGNGNPDTYFFHSTVGGKPLGYYGFKDLQEIDGLDSTAALVAADLDWSIKYEPVSTSSGIVLPGKNLVLRSDTGSPIGIVGDGYQEIDNRTIFEVAGDVVSASKGSASFLGALSQRGGSYVSVMLRIGDDIEVAGNDDERTTPILLVESTHDGTKKLTLQMIFVRVICLNGQVWSTETPRIFLVKHTHNANKRTIEIQRDLGVAFKLTEEVSIGLNKLNTIAMGPKDVFSALSLIVPDPEDAENHTRALAQAENVRLAIRENYLDSTNLQNSPETALRLYNSITEYVDHTYRVHNNADKDDELARTIKESELRWERLTSTNAIKDRAYKVLSSL